MPFKLFRFKKRSVVGIQEELLGGSLSAGLTRVVAKWFFPKLPGFLSQAQGWMFGCVVQPRALSRARDKRKSDISHPLV